MNGWDNHGFILCYHFYSLCQGLKTVLISIVILKKKSKIDKDPTPVVYVLLIFNLRIAS